MLRRATIFTAAIAVIAFAASARCDDSVYVSNHGDNTVSVIDVATDTVTATIPVGSSPVYTLGDNQGLFVYVTCQGSSTIDVIDTSSNTVTNTVPAAEGTFAIKNKPDWAEVYVTSLHSSTSVVSMANLQVQTVVTSGVNATDIAFSPDQQRAYLTDYQGTHVTIISVPTRAPIGTIELGGPSFGIQVDATPGQNRGTQYIAVTNSIFVRNAGGGSTNTVSLPDQPFGLLLNSGGSVLYVTHGANSISTIDTNTLQVTNTAVTGSNPQGIALSADGTKLYVANYGSGTVSVFDSSLNPITTITVGNQPFVATEVNAPTRRAVFFALRSVASGSTDDSDGDGVPDVLDTCPNTTGFPVDSNGCDIDQFCATADATTELGRKECVKLDFLNDEPLMTPAQRDCKVAVGTSGHADDRCVPNQ